MILRIGRISLPHELQASGANDVSIRIHKWRFITEYCRWAARQLQVKQPWFVFLWFWYVILACSHKCLTSVRETTSASVQSQKPAKRWVVSKYSDHGMIWIEVLLMKQRETWECMFVAYLIQNWDLDKRLWMIFACRQIWVSSGTYECMHHAGCAREMADVREDPMILIFRSRVRDV
jgi:hypothetical protein